MRNLAGLLAAIFVGVLNPSAGCGSEDFNFDEAEMSAFLVTKWTGELSLNTSTPTDMTLEIYRNPSGKLQSGLCGSRSFLMASAGACIAMTTMDFNATVDTDDRRYVRSSATGTFLVWGADLDGGNLTVVLNDGTTLDGSVAPSKNGGTVISASGQVFDSGRNVIGNFRLTRLVP